MHAMIVRLLAHDVPSRGGTLWGQPVYVLYIRQTATRLHSPWCVFFYPIPPRKGNEGETKVHPSPWLLAKKRGAGGATPQSVVGDHGGEEKTTPARSAPAAGLA